MSCGAPVVTTNVSSMPEVAGDAAILVAPDDVAGLAAAYSACPATTPCATISGAGTGAGQDLQLGAVRPRDDRGVRSGIRRQVVTTTISISLVVYRQELPILRDTLVSLRGALDRAKRDGLLDEAVLDIVDNGTEDETALDSLVRRKPPDSPGLA